MSAVPGVSVYNAWCRLPEEERTTEELQSHLDYDFFKVLDSVTIARSRKHIQRYYDTTDIGRFPTRNTPVSLRPKLTTLPGAINYHEVFETLNKLKLTIYTPTNYILPSRLFKYLDDMIADGHETRVSENALNKGTVKYIFFVAETKGTMESLKLKPVEQTKIRCAKKLFNELSTEDVVYHDVDSYQSLLDIMEKL